MSQPQPNVETLSFKIGLSGTFWDKRPAFSIWLNDIKYVSGTLETDSVEFFQFTADVIEDQESTLKIRLENKTDKDTIVEDGVIVKDMLLNIESIEIDDIDISTAKWDESSFIGDDPKRPILKKCVNLGWNGAYTLKFESPFYLWLLERL